MLSDRLLQSALASTPIWSDGAVEFVRRWVLPHLRSRQAARCLTGTAREGGTARVLVVGTTSKLDHDTLGPGFFGEPPVVEVLAPIAGYRLLPRLEAELDRHDLVLACVWTAFAGGPKRSFLTMPEQPDMQMPAGSREAMLARATPTMRREIRIAERHGFTLVQTTDDASFERLYRDYHVPFVRARHGDGAVIHADATLRRRLRRGALTWVALAGERLYASAFEIMGDTLREHVVGSLHGRVDDLVRSAAYVARVEHIRRAHAAGLRWLNMGGVAPWLSDGSAIHKRSWGGELVDRYTSHRVLLVGWRRWTPAIARFLATYPILVRRTWGFGAIVAADNDTPAARADAQKVWHRQSPRGLRRLAVVGAGGAVGSLWSLDGGLTEWAFPRPISSADIVRTLDQTGSA